jgi:excisionase family DNA binding protein
MAISARAAISLPWSQVSDRWLSTGGSIVAEPWVSADDIAAHLGVTRDTVYASSAGKGMPAHKFGRLWKFQTSEIDNWVRSGGTADGSHGSRPKAK